MRNAIRHMTCMCSIYNSRYFRKLVLLSVFEEGIGLLLYFTLDSGNSGRYDPQRRCVKTSTRFQPCY